MKGEEAAAAFCIINCEEINCGKLGDAPVVIEKKGMRNDPLLRSEFYFPHAAFVVATKTARREFIYWQKIVCTMQGIRNENKAK